MDKAVNAEKIIIAREFNKLTQIELIGKLEENGIKVTQGELSKIEKGIRIEIPDTLLNVISEVLEFPTSFFLSDWERQNIKGGLYRKRQSLKKKDESFVDSSVNLFIQTFLYLSQKVELAKINVPYFQINAEQSPADVARKTRSFWNVKEGKIDNLIELLEDNGIIINYINIEEDKFDGYSCSLDGYSFIFINPQMPGDRLRYTIAHELGHIIMKNEDNPYPRCEEEANEFASEFLMPEKDIKYDLINLTCEKAYYLKPLWKVSMASLIRRAFDLDTITKSRYTSLNVQMSKLGYKKSEPNPIDKEKPTLFQEIIDSYIEAKVETIEKIAEQMGLSKNVLVKLYKPHRNNIRAIN